MEFVSEYGLFLLKAATIVVAIIVVLGSIVSMSMRPKRQEEGDLVVRKLNDEIDDFKQDLEFALFSEAELKALDKQRRKEEKAKDKAEQKRVKEALKEAKKAAKEEAKAEAAKSAEQKAAEKKAAEQKAAEASAAAEQATQDAEAEDDANDEQEGDDDKRKRVFVLDFNGDVAASESELLRHEITAVLTMARAGDEIVVRLESPGGMVHSYGFAASQLQRIRSKGIELTVCVDQVAASGGYMMAALANKIVAAPFAIVGSIGVVAQLPNFNKVLKKFDIDYELYTAGEYKRTVTMFGENTDKAKEKFQSDLEDTHVLFKQHVSTFRPQVDIEKVANGDIWYGQQALENGLVDELGTSDEYLIKACDNADVFSVRYEYRKTLQEKLGLAVQKGTEKAVARIFTMIQRQHQTKG